MSRTNPNERELEQVVEECHYCGALPGFWCGTKSGRYSTLLHSARFYLWRAKQVSEKLK